MNRVRTLFLTTAAFIVTGVSLPPSVMAQTNYENYTFVTFVGPQESPGWYDGTNSAAGFANPFGAAVDKAGNVYVADTYNHTIRKITPTGVVATLAGNATHSGTNDGVGAAARFYSPEGVTVDTNGNVYVADTYNHAIRKITPTGVVTTLAGSPTLHGTNNGAGSAAQFYYPYGVAVDTNNNVYVADTGNHTIRKITLPDGSVTTLAGLALVSGTNNGTGTAARFYNPFGVTAGTNGNVYVADTYNHTIRQITPAGVVSALAGLPTVSGTNNGTGSTAKFNYPTGVAVEIAGNLYVADYGNQTIRKVTAAGAVTNVAGMAGVSGYTNGTGSAARFNQPSGVAVDGNGNVYIADYGNCLIRKMTSAAVVTNFAGKAGGLGTNDGTGSTARFNYPAGVAVDTNNNVYVADLANHIVRKITQAGVVATLAGLAGSTGVNNGTGSAARFNTPTGIAVDTNGTVYVADTYNQTIRKITPAASVSTFAGSASVSGTNNGTGTAARFNYPFALVVGTNSTVYVADTYNHTVRKITPAGAVTTLAGSPTLFGTNDGVGSAARFYYPQGIAADNLGNVYVADTGNQIIRKVTPAGAVTTLAGAGGSSGFADGTGSAARFHSPFGVAVDGAGNVYVVDKNNSLIRKITPAGVVTTLAGEPGDSGFLDGTGAAARFFTPEGIAFGKNGTLYLADASNHAMRKGYAAPTDVPVVDLPLEKPGVVRHLDVTNLTTTSWSWSIVRYPANSLSQLSSTTNRNPTFTPDLSEVYTIRFQGTDNSGRLAIGMLELVGSGLIEPKISNLRLFSADVVLTGYGGAPGAAYSVLVSSDLSLPMSAWTVLPGNKFDNNGSFTFTNGLSGSLRFYRISVP